MGMGGSSPTPPSISMPPPAAHPGILGSSTADASMKAQKNRATASGPFNADKTIGTSPQGDKPVSTAKSTLLGQ